MGPLITANSKSFWERNYYKTSQGRGQRGKSIAPWVQTKKALGKACHPCCLAEGNHYMIYLTFSEPHAASVLQNYLKPHHPPSSCGKTESTGHRMTHWVSIEGPQSISNQIKIPGDSSALPPLPA